MSAPSRERLQELLDELTEEFGCPVAVIVAADGDIKAVLSDASGCDLANMAQTFLSFAGTIRGNGCCAGCERCGPALDCCEVAAGMLAPLDA